MPGWFSWYMRWITKQTTLKFDTLFRVLFRGSSDLKSVRLCNEVLHTFMIITFSDQVFLNLAQIIIQTVLAPTC